VVASTQENVLGTISGQLSSLSPEEQLQAAAVAAGQVSGSLFCFSLTELNSCKQYRTEVDEIIRCLDNV
jgi:hypothetical protein